MSGHSKWAQIKHQKGITDQKRGQLFSKLLAAITAAAKTETNPDFNPRLRTAVQKAKDNQVPLENIERAIKKASEKAFNIEELLLEAYGSGGSAILIEVITDNKNRTIAEIKKILADNDGKWAESGSVQWAFDKDQNQKWLPKFAPNISEEDRQKLKSLIEELENHNDVQKIYVNIQIA